MTKKRILLVDDDELMRRLYADILSTTYTVDTAIDGEEALKKLKSISYDLVLMDMLLPKINGVEVIAKAKIHRKLTGKVIFLTNMDKQSIADIQKSGYVCLIKSEIDLNTFPQTIFNLLEDR